MKIKFQESNQGFIRVLRVTLREGIEQFCSLRITITCHDWVIVLHVITKYTMKPPARTTTILKRKTKEETNI